MPGGSARLLSCGGTFAGAWQTTTLATAAGRLEDYEFVVTCQNLLGQQVCLPGAACSNLARSGARAHTACGEDLCVHGHHAHKCNRGGGLNQLNNNVILPSASSTQPFSADQVFIKSSD